MCWRYLRNCDYGVGLNVLQLVGRSYLRARQTLEKSFQVPEAVPAFFIEDH